MCGGGGGGGREEGGSCLSVFVCVSSCVFLIVKTACTQPLS